MGTTALSVLKTKLQTAIADDKRIYWEHYADAINNAIREVYPNLHRPLDDVSLITGNILPNSHFEDWATTTYPDHYNVSTVTALEETTEIRGGASSAKVTRAGADGYMYISEVEWPRLLDLMDKTISFKCWVLASSASQAYIEINTEKADGTTTQIETSSAHSGAGEWELLEIEDFELNDDLTVIKFSFKVITADGDVCFDNARITGKTVYEYLLPQDLQDGHISQVYIQTSGYSDDICDDLHPSSWEKVYGWGTVNDGSYKYLRLPAGYSNGRRIRLVGHCPLETLSADTDTVSIDGEKPNLLIAYAAHLLFEMEMGIPSATDVSRYERLSAYWLNKYYRMLPQLKMATPSGTMKIAPW